MKPKIFRWSELNEEEQRRFSLRSEIDIEKSEAAVAPIVEDVRRRGDAALRDYALKFDGADLSDLPIRVQKEEFRNAEAMLSPEVKAALDYAIENVRRFHLGQKEHAMHMVEVRPGILAGERQSPIDSVGLYVPRGRGSFPSMVYMLAVPAVIAGVPEISLVTPPLPDGSVDPACLYAAERAGVKQVYRAGGAQAVAALAFGTESIAPAVKVVGPGSMYVTAAKRLLGQFIDPGLPAGPSESIVIADESADPFTVTLDLMIEAEHGSDSSALLITPDAGLAENVARMAVSYLAEIPEPRRGFIGDVFSGYGGIILTDSIEEAFELANSFATEHLQIQSAHPADLLHLVKNAGEVLLGSGVPFSLANYAVGANAVLPTGGKAKTWSSVSVRDFVKYNSVVQISPGAYGEIAGHVEALADYEGFFTHGEALRARKNPPAWAERDG